MLSKMDTLSMGKRACIYDDELRAQILFSCWDHGFSSYSPRQSFKIYSNLPLIPMERRL